MKVHTAPVGEDPFTKRTGKLLSVVDRIHVGLEIGFAGEVFPALGTREDL